MHNESTQGSDGTCIFLMKKPSVLQPDNSSLKIGEAAEILGVSKDTLRRWEKSGKFTSTRTPSGYRVYNLEELEKIFVKTNQNLTPNLPKAVPNLKFNSYSFFVKSIALLGLVTIILSTILTLGYLYTPKQTLSLTSTKPFLASTKTNSEIEVQAEVLGTSSQENPIVSGFHTVVSTVLIPFNFISQKIVQALTPNYAKDIGIYQNSTNERLNSNEKAIKVVDNKVDNKLGGLDQKLSQEVETLQLADSRSSADLSSYKNTISQRVVTNDAFIGQSVIDSYGNIYPRRIAADVGDKPSLGTPNNRFYGIYANRFSVDTGGNLTVNGQTTLGTEGVDYIKLNGSISTDIIPSANGEISLGKGDKYFKNLYINNINGDQGTITSLSVTSLSLTSSGSFALPNGSASSPALYFTNSTGSGLYRLSSNTIGLITSGSATSGITIDSNGNVGIGTTNPISTLVIAGNTHIGSLRQGISAPTDGLFVDGNVGIGTTTSSNKLDVWGNARITGILTVDGTLSSSGTFTPSGQILAIDGSASAPGYSFSADTDTGLWRIGTNQVALTTNGSAFSGLSVNSNGNVGIGNTSASQIFQVNPNGTSAFVVTSNGNVGIGFSSPQATLDILGSVGSGASSANLLSVQAQDGNLSSWKTNSNPPTCQIK